MKGTTTVDGQETDAVAIGADKHKKQVTIKNFALFTDCISEIIIKQVHNTKDLHAVMLMYNLTECSNDYSKSIKKLFPLLLNIIHLKQDTWYLEVNDHKDMINGRTFLTRSFLFQRKW